MPRSPHPGRVLEERFLLPLGVTEGGLARDIGVPDDDIVALVRGERSLDFDTALRLELFFGVPATWWLAHQARYDASDPTRRRALADVVAPFTERDRLVLGATGARLVDEQPEHVAPVAVSVSPDLLARLEAQVGAKARPTERTAKVVKLPNGSVALVGDGR